MQKIMFNDRYGLTDAVLCGRKIVTRRVIPQDIAETLIVKGDSIFPDIPCEGLMEYSRYKVGEEVAIAQAYENLNYNIGTEEGAEKFNTLSKTAGWGNKMFVKAELMLHRIRITDIRVERLQDIGDKDCLREGVYKSIFGYYVDGIDAKDTYYFPTPREAFAALIDKVSGKGTWESNPYVWVYSFQLIK